MALRYMGKLPTHQKKSILCILKVFVTNVFLKKGCSDSQNMKQNYIFRSDRLYNNNDTILSLDKYFFKH